MAGRGESNFQADLNNAVTAWGTTTKFGRITRKGGEYF